MFCNSLLPTKYTCRQILLFSIGVCDGISAGAVPAFQNILLSQLDLDESIFLNDNQIKMLVILPSLLVIPSSLLSGIILQWVGRKFLLFNLEVIGLTAWLMIYFSRTATILVVANTFFGVTLGGCFPTFLTYIGEVAKPTHRAVFLSAIPMGILIGNFACNLVGSILHWRLIASVFLLCALYNTAILLLIMQESYVTSLKRNKVENARKLFEWFRGHDNESKTELEAAIEIVNEDICKSYFNKGFFIPLVLSILLFLTNELTGFRVMDDYTHQVLQMFESNDIYYFTSFDILECLIFVISLLLIKMLSIKFIFLYSGYSLGILLVALSAVLFLFGFCNAQISSLVLLIFIRISYWVGFSLIPVILCGEVFPQRTRSIGIAISFSFSFLFSYCNLNYLPSLTIILGPNFTLIMFGICTLCGVILIHQFILDTKYKTLQEINNQFKNVNESEIYS